VQGGRHKCRELVVVRVNGLFVFQFGGGRQRCDELECCAL
jgi:hypothetical protein